MCTSVVPQQYTWYITRISLIQWATIGRYNNSHASLIQLKSLVKQSVPRHWYISHATCRCELSRAFFVSLAVLARRSGARRTRPTWKSNSVKGLSMPVRQSTSPHPINFPKAKNRLIVIILQLISHSNCQIYVWIGRFTRDTNVLSSPWLERMTVDNNAGNFCF